MLQPGENIEPTISLQKAQDLVLEYYELKTTKIKELNSYDDKNFYIEAKSIKDGNEGKYVLKVLNSMDSKSPYHVEAENECIKYLDINGIICPVALRSNTGSTLPLIEISGSSSSDKNDNSNSTKFHIIRLLTFVEGKILHEVPNVSKKLLFNMGEYIANVDNILKNFQHSGLENHSSIWFLSSVPTAVPQFMYVVKDPAKFKLVQEVISTYEKRVVPSYPHLEKGAIHGDFNEQNIIVNLGEDGEFKIHGLLDFGDMQIGHYLFEISIMLCYMMLESQRTGSICPIEGAGHALAGYHKTRNVTQTELELLRTCICGRLCQSLVMGLYTHTLHPQNDYILTTQKSGWSLLELLWREKTDEQIVGLWKNIIQSYN